MGLNAKSGQVGEVEDSSSSLPNHRIFQNNPDLCHDGAEMETLMNKQLCRRSEPREQKDFSPKRIMNHHLWNNPRMIYQEEEKVIVIVSMKTMSALLEL